MPPFATGQFQHGTISAQGQNGLYHVSIGGGFPFLDVPSIHPGHQYGLGQTVTMGFLNPDAPVIISKGFTHRGFPTIDAVWRPCMFERGNALRTHWAKGLTSSITPLGPGSVLYEFENGDSPGLCDGTYLYGKKGYYKVKRYDITLQESTPTIEANGLGFAGWNASVIKAKGNGKVYWPNQTGTTDWYCASYFEDTFEKVGSVPAGNLHPLPSIDLLGAGIKSEYGFGMFTAIRFDGTAKWEASISEEDWTFAGDVFAVAENFVVAHPFYAAEGEGTALLLNGTLQGADGTHGPYFAATDGEMAYWNYAYSWEGGVEKFDRALTPQDGMYIKEEGQTGRPGPMAATDELSVYCERNNYPTVQNRYTFGIADTSTYVTSGFTLDLSDYGDSVWIPHITFGGVEGEGGRLVTDDGIYYTVVKEQGGTNRGGVIGVSLTSGDIVFEWVKAGAGGNNADTPVFIYGGVIGTRDDSTGRFVILRGA